MIFHPCNVSAIRRSTADSAAITLAPPPGAERDFAFTPGQYLTIAATLGGEEHRRSYSLCSAPGEPLTIGVKAVPGGAVSGWLTTALRPGDTLRCAPPEGRFGLTPDPAAPPRTLLGIACGSGITPILSIARSVLATEPASRVLLLYGNRSAADIMFREALDDLKDRHLARLTTLHVLSREKHELAALHGRLDAARIAALLPGLARPGDIAAAFLCGPAGMPEAATAALTGLGIAPERIHTERFTPAAGTPRRAPAPPPPADAPAAAMAAITLDGVTREVPVAEGETILEAGLRAGLDLPWSCRGGMCCTCRARVTAGSVAMDLNYSLQPWEEAAGFVLTCQGRARTPAVAVDYDAA